MYFVLALLAFGAVCVAFFVAIFAGGALFGLASLCLQALRPAGRIRDAGATASLPKAALRAAHAPEVSKARPHAESGAAYAAA